MSLIDEVIGKEINSDIRNETLQLLREKGPSLRQTLLRLKQELDAKETKLIKLKGGIDEKDLPKGYKLIATTGLLEYEDGKKAFGTGESLLACNFVSHNPRLKAIDIILSLYDALPSKKHEHSGSINLNSELLDAILTGLPDDFARTVCDKLGKIVSKK